MKLKDYYFDTKNNLKSMHMRVLPKVNVNKKEKKSFYIFCTKINLPTFSIHFP